MQTLPSLIDTHCHLDMILDKWQESATLEQAIAAARLAAVIHIASDRQAMEFIDGYRQQSHPFRLFYTLGQHPGEVGEGDPWLGLKLARERAGDPDFVAVGEVGLDYYYHKDTSAQQKEVFAAYIDLALELGRPLAIHTREAHADTLAALQKAAGKIPVIIHCFSATAVEMQDFLALGCYISFSGIVTFKKAEALQEAARLCPPDRLLIETDAPFLAPVPHRGKLNQPAYLQHTLEFIANLRGLAPEQLAEITRQNSQKAFLLPLRAG